MDILHGTLLLWRNPRLWGLCVGPLFAAVFLYIALGIGGGMLLVPYLQQWAGKIGPEWLGTVGFVAVWIVLFPFLFTLLAGAFAGVIFEPLSLAVEKVVRGGSGTAATDAADVAPLSGGAAFRDTLARLALSVTLALLSFGLGFVFGPVPGILAASVIGLLDYTSPIYARRGKTLGPQGRDLFGAFNARTVTFALAAGFVSLIPIVGVLMLPGMVAGGTLLVLGRDRK